MNLTPATKFKAIEILAGDARADGVATSSAIDTAGWSGILLALFVNDKTDGSIAVAATECDTSGGTYTAAASPYTALFTTVADGTTGANTTQFSTIRFNTDDLKRYLKVAATVASNAGSCSFGIIGWLYGPADSAQADTTFDKTLPTPP